MTLTKLNTNESPFPPSPKAIELSEQAAKELYLYSDPECRDLKAVASEYFGINEDQIIFTNGSDDVLNFAFCAFCDESRSAVFPDITYGFYSVFADYNHVPFETIPLKDDFTIDINDYIGINKNIFIANPNAPTGIALPLCDIEKIVKSNPDNVVVIDEAYVDFGGESAIKLIDKYNNLIVTQTFSKSRSMAGARLGFAVGNADLIADLNTIKYSTNPYNVNRMTAAAGIGALLDNDYFKSNCKAICENRSWTVSELNNLDFFVLDSKANFVFAKSDKIDGKTLYSKLREKGILVRHFDTARLRDFNRITIGSKTQMQTLINAIKSILEELE
jgi:histidinol-phosphate aminotransferase